MLLKIPEDGLYPETGRQRKIIKILLLTWLAAFIYDNVEEHIDVNYSENGN